MTSKAPLIVFNYCGTCLTTLKKGSFPRVVFAPFSLSSHDHPCYCLQPIEAGLSFETLPLELVVGSPTVPGCAPNYSFHNPSRPAFVPSSLSSVRFAPVFLSPAAPPHFPGGTHPNFADIIPSADSPGQLYAGDFLDISAFPRSPSLLYQKYRGSAPPPPKRFGVFCFSLFPSPFLIENRTLASLRPSSFPGVLLS